MRKYYGRGKYRSVSRKSAPLKVKAPNAPSPWRGVARKPEMELTILHAVWKAVGAAGTLWLNNAGRAKVESFLPPELRGADCRAVGKGFVALSQKPDASLRQKRKGNENTKGYSFTPKGIALISQAEKEPRARISTTKKVGKVAPTSGDTAELMKVATPALAVREQLNNIADAEKVLLSQLDLLKAQREEVQQGVSAEAFEALAKIEAIFESLSVTLGKQPPTS